MSEKKPGTPYQPYSGEEGRSFEDRFCNRCKRDQKYWETMDGADACVLHTFALWMPADDPDYPKEWTYTEEGKPTCTAFERIEDE